MNNLILPSSSGATMSSREIAELTSKRHDQVMRDIRNMFYQLDIRAHTFEGTYLSEQNKELPCFNLDRIHVECLITGYSAPLRMMVLVRLKELESNAPKLTHAEMTLMVISNLQFEVAEQAKQIELAAPKVEFVDKYVTADSGSKGFRQVAKLLNANEKEFRAFLSDSKIMYKLGGEWMPYQCHADAGRFEVKGGVADNDHVYNSALFTPKGINWIAGLWAQHCLKNNEPASTVDW